MILIIAFIIGFVVSMAYHSTNPPTQAQRHRACQNGKAAAQVLGIAAITTCVKLIKEKE